MTLQEKFENVGIVYDKALNLIKNNVQIADDFAIGFAEWLNVNAYKYPTTITTKELLKIYKKEKGL